MQAALPEVLLRRGDGLIIMVDWEHFHGWMRFSRLDVGTGLDASFTIAYRFVDDPAEKWTMRFNHFKDNRPDAVYHAQRLMAQAIPDLVRRLEIAPDHTAVVPCIASAETTASPTGAVGSIARRCAEEAGVRFIGNAVTKKAHVRLSSLRTAEERQRALASAGYSATRIAARNILLFDDFITQGATLSAVASVIRRTNKSHVRIFGVALGKNERVAYLKEHGREASNDHVRPEWLKQWPLGSQP